MVGRIEGESEEGAGRGARATCGSLAGPGIARAHRHGHREG